MKYALLRFFTKTYLSINRSVFNSGSILWKSSLMIKGGVLKLNNCKLNRCNIRVFGTENLIMIDGELYKTDIRVNGNGNLVIIGKECKLAKTNIVVRGNNCKVLYGNGTTVGGSYVVCQGKDNYVSLGQGCMLSENIDIWSSDSHPIYDESNRIINYSKPIDIGNHVWLGKGVKILKGVTIGDNSIIGMDSLVTSDIESNSLNAGIPCHQIRKNINWDRIFIDC